jgi:MinD-like ATPase involved in chromosome partitioning or flagellar assembly
LTASDIETLILACATGIDELVIDLSSQCDERVQKIFQLSDTVLIICDPSSTSQAKLAQFINQHNVFGQIWEKAVLVNNKGARKTETFTIKSIQLPFLQSPDPVSVFKSLSSGDFDL